MPTDKPLAELLTLAAQSTPAPTDIQADATTCIHALGRIWAETAYQMEGISARCRKYGLTALAEAMGDKGEMFIAALESAKGAWELTSPAPFPDMPLEPVVEEAVPEITE